MNKLVDFLMDAAYFLIRNTSINPIDSKQLAFEIYRSLGSLIFQSGSKLNPFNLNRLFGNNDAVLSKTRLDLSVKDGLLFLIREQVEADIQAMASLKIKDDAEAELNYKLNLITTQLLFNITMPAELAPNETNGFSLFIDDTYKIKAAHLLIRILRFQNSNSCLSNQIAGLEQQANMAKILTKCLQGLENLFSATQAQLATDPNQSLNWLQSHSSYFQLGDILAIAKVTFILLHFYL